MLREIEYSSETMAWWNLPPLIEFMRKSRIENTSITDSMNISIILHSATIIEGFINELLNSALGYIGDNPTRIGRLESEFKQHLEKSSWIELQYLYKIMFGTDLSSDCTNEIWKSVISLFDLRNILTHSKRIRVTAYEDNGTRKIKMDKKYKKIYDFLALEKKIIELVDITHKYPEISIISNESADFFWDITTQFIYQIIDIRKGEVNNIKDSVEKSFKNKWE